MVPSGPRRRWMVRRRGVPGATSTWSMASIKSSRLNPAGFRRAAGNHGLDAGEFRLVVQSHADTQADVTIVLKLGLCMSLFGRQAIRVSGDRIQKSADKPQLEIRRHRFRVGIVRLFLDRPHVVEQHQQILCRFHIRDATAQIGAEGIFASARATLSPARIISCRVGGSM